LTYWENGQLKRNDIYDRGKFVKGNCYTRDGKDTTHYDFDIYPQFPGGDTAMSTFLRINVKYPRKAVRKNIQGKVWVRFIVEKDGRLTDIHVLDGVNKVLDEEALRVVSLMPNWVPSKLDGVAIRRGKTVPINFSLSNN
jgi:TonB family protein